MHTRYGGMVMLRKGGLASPMRGGECRDLRDTGHWSSAATCPQVTPGVKG